MKLFVLSITTSNWDNPAKENLGVFSTIDEARKAGEPYGINTLIESFELDSIPTKPTEYILPVYR